MQFDEFIEVDTPGVVGFVDGQLDFLFFFC